MKNKYLIINDDNVINKLKELLRFREPDMGVGANLHSDNFDNKNNKSYSKKNPADYLEAVSMLRRLSFSETTSKTSNDDLDKYIDNYLFLLRIDKNEASLCLERFLDVMLDNISTVYKLDSFKRLTCILAIIFRIQFGEKSGIDGPFLYGDSKKLKEEDKNYLINIFINENDYAGLNNIIKSYYDCDSSFDEQPTVETANNMFKKFQFILMKYLNRGVNGISKYDDIYKFVDYFRTLIIENNLIILLEKEYSNFIEPIHLLLALLSYNKQEILCEKSELKQKILCKKSNLNKSLNSTKFPLFLFHYAKFFRIESRKKETEQRIKYLEEANNYILDAESNIKSKTTSGSENSIALGKILIEKSCILSEMKKYNESYNEIISAMGYLKNYSNNDDKAKHYLMLISSQYLKLKKGENNFEGIAKTVIDKIDEFIDSSEYQLEDFKPIVEFVNDDTFLKGYNKLRVKVYSQLLILLSEANLILEKSKITDTSKYNILYYTRAENLKLLLEDESDSEINYRLPLFHANHMNDPEEGRVLKTLLEKDTICSTNTANFNPICQKYDENYVFLKSFFVCEKNKFNEFLPMWVQYGDDAKGVCVILNSSTFDNIDLFRVNYLDDTGKCEDPDINTYIKSYKETYKNLVTLCDIELAKNIEFKEGMLDLVEYINSRIVYLFKHKSYEHENEARIIVTKSNSDLKDIRTIPGNVPKLYLYSNSQTYIDEIILGSKMEIPDNYVPFIHLHGKKMWSNNDKKRQITVSKSKIQYR